MTEMRVRERERDCVIHYQYTYKIHDGRGMDIKDSKLDITITHNTVGETKVRQGFSIPP